jgi:hypothetical protein
MVVSNSSAEKGERRKERWEGDKWGKETEERKEEMVEEEKEGTEHRSRKYDQIWACQSESEAKGAPLSSQRHVRDKD